MEYTSYTFGGRTLQGLPCHNCGETYQKCSKRLLSKGGVACCGACYSTSTHNEREVDSSNIPPHVQVIEAQWGDSRVILHRSEDQESWNGVIPKEGLLVGTTHPYQWKAVTITPQTPKENTNEHEFPPPPEGYKWEYSPPSQMYPNGLLSLIPTKVGDMRFKAEIEGNKMWIIPAAIRILQEVEEFQTILRQMREANKKQMPSGDDS